MSRSTSHEAPAGTRTRWLDHAPAAAKRAVSASPAVSSTGARTASSGTMRAAASKRDGDDRSTRSIKVVLPPPGGPTT